MVIKIPTFNLFDLVEILKALEQCPAAEEACQIGTLKECDTCILNREYKGEVWGHTGNTLCIAINELRIGHQPIPKDDENLEALWGF